MTRLSPSLYCPFAHSKGSTLGVVRVRLCHLRAPLCVCCHITKQRREREEERRRRQQQKTPNKSRLLRQSRSCSGGFFVLLPESACARSSVTPECVHVQFPVTHNHLCPRTQTRQCGVVPLPSTGGGGSDLSPGQGRNNQAGISSGKRESIVRGV